MNNERMKPLPTMEVTILGCGSASPNQHHLPSCQVLNHNNALYMLDCGEGAQHSMCRHGLSINKLKGIFITHLHGDHCLGLPGLLSTMALLGRTTPLTLAGPQGLTQFVDYILGQFVNTYDFAITINELDDNDQSANVYTDHNITVQAFPLTHRVPSFGYMIKEITQARHIDPTKTQQYQLGFEHYPALQLGLDVTLPIGQRIPNEAVTTPGRRARSYAYCTDTAFTSTIIPYIQGVSTLYHEATFDQSLADLASQTGHSTATDAANMALRANAQQLLIGHLSSRYANAQLIEQEARATFANTTAVNEGMTININNASEQ